MIRFMKLAGLLYMILVMILYFTFIDIIKEFERIVGTSWAGVILTIVSVVGFLSLMSLMKRSGSGSISDEDYEEEYEEIDFSKNSPTVSREEAKEVRPIDLTGNVFEHNKETMESDLDFLKKDKE